MIDGFYKRMAEDAYRERIRLRLSDEFRTTLTLKGRIAVERWLRRASSIVRASWRSGCIKPPC